MSLDELRKRIDALDDELLALIAQRAELASEVARHKRKHKLPARDPAREAAMLARARSVARPPLTPETAEVAMRALIESTRALAQLRSARRAPTRRVTIVGLGLIGGSLARVLKSSNPEHVIRGVELPAHSAPPATSGLFATIHAPEALGEAVWDAEVVFLCAPPGVNTSLLKPLRAAVQGDALVTDVGGLKAGICRLGRKLYSRSRGPWFVGGHPMAGAARGGFDGASELMFVGRPWVLTPHRKHAVPPLKRLQRLIESTGAHLALMGPDEHDRTMAAISHLPQILALALSLSAAGRGRGLAGPAFLEMTRLAESPAALWADLFRAGNGQVIQEVQRLRTYLTEFEMALAFNEPLETWFERAATRRRQVIQDP